MKFHSENFDRNCRRDTCILDDGDKYEEMNKNVRKAVATAKETKRKEFVQEPNELVSRWQRKEET
jgi:hypothetical protein